jgi:hypothetical protein
MKYPRLSLALLLTLVTPFAAPAQEGSRLFKPPTRPAVPQVKNAGWVRNPIDAFVLARMEKAGLTPSAPADKLRLLRRVTVDLTGLPPTVAEQEAFLADDSPDAYEKAVDRLLASPAHGERWAQHWLDLVRYAETDGFKADDLRPDAHKYRDYVIRAFNDDKPYDRFVRQQLAGDELEPGNVEALVATGYIRLYPDEYNAANLEQRRQEILDDITSVTGLAFLAMTFGCARCHDHKFDPIDQVDYYGLQAFFAAMQPSNPPALDPAALHDYQRKMAAWREASKPVRKEMDKLLERARANSRKRGLSKFRPEIQKTVLTPSDQRTPYQKQIAYLAEKQVKLEIDKAPTKLKGAQKKKYEELKRKLEAIEPARPKVPPSVMAITDVGPESPPVHRLLTGNWQKPREKVEPHFPPFLGKWEMNRTLPAGVEGTGLRAALARWLTQPDHPLTARVMANRLWQHHFGQGIIPTPNDFGMQGTPATHPDLLDWLAVEFVENGWSLKHLHRLMVTSAAYRQDSRVDPEDPGHVRALARDRENNLLWHARRRRLEGESLRDAMLTLSGEYNPRMFGKSALPKLPAKISKYAWKPNARVADRHRRSVYVLAKRNMRYPMFDAFDLPDMHNSCARRAKTTTAPQALLLLNGDFTQERAEKWARRLSERFPESETALVAHAYQEAWGRVPTDEEVQMGVRFLSTQTGRLKGARTAALADFCHALLNTNEFLYVD